MFSEILDADYIWATIITEEIAGRYGLGDLLPIDLSDRHPGGNSGAFCDGHAEMIRQDEIRDPHSPFWRVVK